MTPKQQRFVTEYLIDLNATAAAIRAGYSEATANTQGPRLLEDPAVQAAIDAAKIERSEETGINAERVLQEIATMAFYDPADLMIDDVALDGENPSVVINGRIIHGLRGPADIRRLPENVRRAIVGWGYDRHQNFTVKLADKSKALDQLARHLSLYNDKLAIQDCSGLADRLSRACSGPRYLVDRVDRRLEHDASERSSAAGPEIATPTTSDLVAAAEPLPVQEPTPVPKPVYRPITPVVPAASFSWPETQRATDTDYNPLDER